MPTANVNGVYPFAMAAGTRRIGRLTVQAVLGATEVAGFIGAGIAGAAYVPQITHLITAHCSAGISRVAFGLWLVASLLVTSHAVAIRAGVFIFLGVVQIVASLVIFVYAKIYDGQYCPVHLPHVIAARPPDNQTP